jgi:hypothetical protein
MMHGQRIIKIQFSKRHAMSRTLDCRPSKPLTPDETQGLTSKNPLQLARKRILFLLMQSFDVIVRSADKSRCILGQGRTCFQKIWQPSQNPRRQKD